MAGLVVIVALGLYAAFAVFVARRVGRLAKSGFGRNAIVVSIVVVLLVAPVADGIYGYFVLQRLCATEAKAEVLKPIKIPDEYFNLDGSPRFLARDNRQVDWRMLSNVVRISTAETKNYRINNLDRDTRSLIEFQTGAVLVRKTNFYYRGGWLQYNGVGFGNETCISAPSLNEILIRAASFR